MKDYTGKYLKCDWGNAGVVLYCIPSGHIKYDEYSLMFYIMFEKDSKEIHEYSFHVKKYQIESGADWEPIPEAEFMKEVIPQIFRA